MTALIQVLLHLLGMQQFIKSKANSNVYNNLAYTDVFVAVACVQGYFHVTIIHFFNV